MSDTNHKPDMRHPEKSDATKAAEKKIREAPFTSPFTSAAKDDTASQNAGAQNPAEGHTPMAGSA